jgi:flavin reductase (DIM6/NTAB) family NADH-FMN oxidoreductase RutF
MTTPSWTERTLGESETTLEDQDAYKLLNASAAKGVAVVSALHRGWDNAVTVTDYLSVSYDPPTMLVSLYGLSRMAEAVAGTGRWGVSVLAADQRAVADALGEEGRPLVGLLGQIPYFRREEGAPALVSGALTWFELRTVAVHEAATHLLFVGEVVAMGTAGSAVQAPLVRFQSGYRRDDPAAS